MGCSLLSIAEAFLFILFFLFGLLKKGGHDRLNVDQKPKVVQVIPNEEVTF